MIPAEEKTLGKHLKRWRKLRGLSQFGLALAANVSARHVSFVETGRSQPSREMVDRLAEALAVPLRHRNTLLLAAGYAPAYRETGLDDASMVRVQSALAFLLRKHDPYPAFVLDRRWNIVQANTAHEWLLPKLLPDAGSGVKPVNVLRLVFDPKLLKSSIVNWDVVASVLLRRARQQLVLTKPDHELEALLDWITGLPHVKRLERRGVQTAGSDILLPTVFNIAGTMISWFSTIATFGTPQDITVEELRIECLFPADDATESFIRNAIPLRRTRRPKKPL